MSLFTRRRPSPADTSFPQFESAENNPTREDASSSSRSSGDAARSAVRTDERPERESEHEADVQFADVSFAELGVPEDFLQVLEENGITAPFPVQALTIPDAFAGRDVCGKAKTGSGKTLAFGIPLVDHTTTARSRRPRSLVLVPTRELANQVAESLAPFCEARGLWLMAVYGGVSINRQIAGLRQGVDLVIATPGRLNDLLERGDISLEDVDMVVLDEADQMADMGFLPQVERILKLVDRDTQTLLFSATLDGDIGKLVDRYQNDPVQHEVISDTVTVDTLEQRFIGVTSETKTDVTARILAGAARAIVFVRTTHGADRLVRILEREGLKAGAIHGRKSQSQRERALDGFSKGHSPILVATNVAARGLHIDHVDLVLHYDPPEDAKVYLHRSGRTARAGEDGLVVTLVLPEQLRDVYQIEREAGIDYEILQMHPEDPRLGQLAEWDPPRGLPRDLGMHGTGGSGGSSRSAQPQRRAKGAAAGARNGGPNRSGDGRRSAGPWRRRQNRRAPSNG